MKISPVSELFQIAQSHNAGKAKMQQTALKQTIKADSYTFSGNYPAKLSADMLTNYNECPKLEAKNNELEIPLDTAFFLYNVHGEEINFRLHDIPGAGSITWESTITPNIQYDHYIEGSYFWSSEETALSIFLGKFTKRERIDNANTCAGLCYLANIAADTSEINIKLANLMVSDPIASNPPVDFSKELALVDIDASKPFSINGCWMRLNALGLVELADSPQEI
jgi:hypothetical protein